MANYRGVKTNNSGCKFSVDGANPKSYESGSITLFNTVDASL